ncbi:hypothetical protein BUE80_DR008288 [Diplocarpon rosae]|nr:hypothetical protein BUE80_DR008288 [Diplocarpon rosae]
MSIPLLSNPITDSSARPMERMPTMGVGGSPVEEVKFKAPLSRNPAWSAADKTAWACCRDAVVVVGDGDGELG